MLLRRTQSEHDGIQETKMSLKIGLINNVHKYLTAETFGNKLNVSATSLRAKQVWVLEQERHDSTNSSGYLRSSKGLYLEASKTGHVSCDAEAKTDDARFEITTMANGEMAFRSQYGQYLSGDEDRVSCTSLKQNESTAWQMQLVMHPQLNMRSVGRKRFVRTDDGELRADVDVPWGPEAVLLLMFHRGKYFFQASNGKYLSNNGELCENFDEALPLVLEIHDGGHFAFKSIDGNYVVPQGPKGQLVVGKKTVLGSKKDELFSVQDSKAQCTLKASNGRYVSIKQGVDVKANQNEAAETETFQMEMAEEGGTMAFYAINDHFWSVKSTSGVVTAESESSTSATVFTVSWQGGTAAMATSEGKSLAIKSGGQVIESRDQPCEWFTLRLVNRPLIALRGEFGFVGVTKSGRVECNRGGYDLFELLCEEDDSGYKIKTRQGMFLATTGDGGMVVTAQDGHVFNLQLVKKSGLAIVTADGRFICGGQNGDFKALEKPTNVKHSLWEF